MSIILNSLPPPPSYYCKDPPLLLAPPAKLIALIYLYTATLRALELMSKALDLIYWGNKFQLNLLCDLGQVFHL